MTTDFKIMMTFWRCTLFAALLFVAGCSFFDSDSRQPAYLQIDSATITTTIPQGGDSHGIEDVWVYVDGQIIGVYPLPATVPIIPTGSTQEVRLVAGVKENGVNSGSKEYPFYEPISESIDFVAGETVTRSLTYRYIEDAVFDFVDGFEGNTLLDLDFDENETDIQLSTDEAKTGSYSCKFVVNSEDREMVVTSVNSVPEERSKGGAIYLELDYKGDQALLIGVLTEERGTLEERYIFATRPTNEWTRFYIDLTGTISNDIVKSYRVLLGVGYENTSVTEGTVYVDNLRFVHF